MNDRIYGKLNKEEDHIHGKLNREKVLKQYEGIESKTTKTIVNNKDNTIKVDIIRDTVTLDELYDVEIENKKDGQGLLFDDFSRKWKNRNLNFVKLYHKLENINKFIIINEEGKAVPAPLSTILTFDNKTIKKNENNDYEVVSVKNKNTGNYLSGQYIDEELDKKVDKEEGKSLTKNDLTDILKSNYDDAYQHSITSGNAHNTTFSQLGGIPTTVSGYGITDAYTKTETDTKLEGKLDTTLKGENSGLAELDSSGHVPTSQLPSFVDDVLEFPKFDDLPDIGEEGKIYVTLDTNIIYRWGGTQYVEISASLALGETNSTAYRGDHGKIAYDHSQIIDGSNPHNTTFDKIGSTPTTISGYGIKDAVTSDTSQTITGDKDFTGALKKDGVAVATTTDLDDKIDKENLVTSFGEIPSDEKVISEKLAKDTFDDKIDKTSIISSFNEEPTDTTIPSEKLTKTALDTKFDKIDVVNSFGVETSDDKAPSEKLTKDSLDLKVDKTIAGDKRRVYGIDAQNAQELIEIETTPTTGSTKLTTSGAIKDALDAKLEKTNLGNSRRVYGIDASNNQEMIEVETTLIENSTNLVTSGSIYTGLATKEPLLPINPDESEDMFLGLDSEGNKIWKRLTAGISSSSGSIYLSNEDSDVDGYKMLSNDLDETETVFEKTANNDEKLIATFLYDKPIGVDIIDAGTWHMHLFCKVSDAANMTRFKLMPFAYHEDETETDLFAEPVLSQDINNTSYAFVEADYMSEAVEVLPTDRIGVRISMITNRTSPMTASFKVGNGYASFVALPLALRHPQLRGLNDDPNYQHITLDEKNKLATVGNNAEENIIESIKVDNAALTVTNKEVNIDLSGKLDKKPDGTNDLLVSNKLSPVYVPDFLLGQMLYGGTFNATTALATLSANAKAKLGTENNTITLTNDTTAITGYTANEGIYYLANAIGTFAGISFEVGDWLVSTVTGWGKVDNTDAVTGVKGSSEASYRIGNVNITKDNIGLSNVDNTSDQNKPISTATQTALDLKATKLNIAQDQVPRKIGTGSGEPNAGISYTASATANTLMVRDANGQTRIVAGTENTHVVNKSQLDAVQDAIPANSDFTLTGLGEKSYNNLTDRPTIPTNSSFTLAGLSEKSYNSLTDKPTIPVAPTIVQDTGTSATSIMSQKAVTDKLAIKDDQPYSQHSTGAGNGYRLVAKFDYSASPTGDTRKVFRFKVKQGHGNGTSYVFWGDYIVGLGTLNQITCSGLLSKSDGTFGKCGYRLDAAKHTIYFYIYTGQYSAYFTSDITSLTRGTTGTVTWYTENGLTADTVVEGVNTFYPTSSGTLVTDEDLNEKLDKTTSGSKRRVYGVNASNNQEMIEFDTTPTESSTKLITSSGVYTAIQTAIYDSWGGEY